MNGLTIRRRYLPHWELTGSIYFATFRTKNYLFSDAEKSIIQEVLLSKNQIEYRLFIACIMPDHVHVITQPLEVSPGNWQSLLKIVKYWKGVSSLKINQYNHRSGSIWLNETFDRIIRNQGEFDEVWTYILMNPVKQRLVSEIDEYPFTIVPESISIGGQALA